MMAIKQCTKCQHVLPLAEFHQTKQSNDGHKSRCKGCRKAESRLAYLANRQRVLEYTKAYAKRPGIKARRQEREKNRRRRDPRPAMITAARARARRFGLPFDLRPSDLEIPVLCPVLGIALNPNTGKQCDSSPSLDRIIPSLGYVPSNVVIVSWRANKLRNDSTLSEMRALLSFYERLIESGEK